MNEPRPALTMKQLTEKMAASPFPAMGAPPRRAQFPGASAEGLERKIELAERAHDLTALSGWDFLAGLIERRRKSLTESILRDETLTPKRLHRVRGRVEELDNLIAQVEIIKREGDRAEDILNQKTIE